MQGRGNQTPQTQDTKTALESYRRHINCADTRAPYPEIVARLRTFTLEQIQTAIDNFARNAWRMEHQAGLGASWFFSSDERIATFIQLRAHGSAHGSEPDAPQTVGPDLGPMVRAWVGSGMPARAIDASGLSTAQVWDRVKAELEDKLSPMNHKLMLSGTRLVAIADTAVIAVTCERQILQIGRVDGLIVSALARIVDRPVLGCHVVSVPELRPGSWYDFERQ